MKYEVAHRRIWFKGEILDVNDAKINILAPTSQFGLNVFEGIPCYWNDEEKQLYAFRLYDHYDRLLRSVKLRQMNMMKIFLFVRPCLWTDLAHGGRMVLLICS